VIERVVEGENRRLLPAVLGLRGRECRGDLVDQLSLLPELSGEVEEQLQLRGNVAEARRVPNAAGRLRSADCSAPAAT
jgi:hypothetical protein